MKSILIIAFCVVVLLFPFMSFAGGSGHSDNTNYNECNTTQHEQVKENKGKDTVQTVQPVVQVQSPAPKEQTSAPVNNAVVVPTVTNTPSSVVPSNTGGTQVPCSSKTAPGYNVTTGKCETVGKPPQTQADITPKVVSKTQPKVVTVPKPISYISLKDMPYTGAPANAGLTYWNLFGLALLVITIVCAAYLYFIPKP